MSYSPCDKKPDNIIARSVANDPLEYLMAVVNLEPNIIKFWSDVPEEVLKTAIRLDGRVIEHIDNPTEELQILAIDDNRSECIKYIKWPTEKVQIMALKRYISNFRYINNPTYRVKLMALKKDGRLIEVIKNPTEELKLLALINYSSAIHFIKNPSDDLIRLALESNGSIISKISNPTEEQQLIAVKNDGLVIRYLMPGASEAVQLAAVKQNASSFEYLYTFPSSIAVQLAAVQGNLLYINNVDPIISNKVLEVINKITVDDILCCTKQESSLDGKGLLCGSRSDVLE